MSKWEFAVACRRCGGEWIHITCVVEGKVGEVLGAAPRLVCLTCGNEQVFRDMVRELRIAS